MSKRRNAANDDSLGSVSTGVTNTWTAAQNFSGLDTFVSATDATSSTSGPVKFNGGISVAKTIWAGAAIWAGTTLNGASANLGSINNQIVCGVGTTTTINVAPPASNSVITLQDNGHTTGNFLTSQSGIQANQATSLATAVTVNKPFAQIGLFSTLGAGATATFTINNTYINVNTLCMGFVTNTYAGAGFSPMLVSFSASGAGSVTCQITNPTASPSTGIPIVSLFFI